MEPAATFLDRMDAIICPGESMDSGRSTEIRMSSTGASRAAPPQARQPRSRRTISCRRFGLSSTCASSSMVSAVPAGEVMARLEVLGISMPCAATIGTSSILVRLPGIPPIQCLSATSGPPVQPLASLDHGAGEREHLVPAHAAVAAGDQEGRHLHLGIAVVHDIPGQGQEFLVAQRVARNLAVHRGQRGRRLGMRNPHRMPFPEIELIEGLLAQAQLVRRQDIAVVDHVEHRQHPLAAGTDLDLGQGLEALGTIDLAVTVHIGDVFTKGVDRDAAQSEGLATAAAH